MFGWHAKRMPIIQHPLADEFYQYIHGLRFDPGAAGEGFLQPTSLPVISFRGRARVAGQYFKPLQPPQVYFNQQNGIVGLGGLQAGQIISQPLLDPTQDNQ